MSENDEKRLSQLKSELVEAYKVAALKTSDPAFVAVQNVLESTSDLGCLSK